MRQELSWDEAFNFAASKFKGIQEKYGRDAIGAITSSRCTNEETFLDTVLQKPFEPDEIISALFG